MRFDEMLIEMASDLTAPVRRVERVGGLLVVVAVAAGAIGLRLTGGKRQPRARSASRRTAHPARVRR